MSIVLAMQGKSKGCKTNHENKRLGLVQWPSRDWNWQANEWRFDYSGHETGHKTGGHGRRRTNLRLGTYFVLVAALPFDSSLETLWCNYSRLHISNPSFISVPSCTPVFFHVPNADRPVESNTPNSSLAYAGGYTTASCTKGLHVAILSRQLAG